MNKRTLGRAHLPDSDTLILYALGERSTTVETSPPVMGYRAKFVSCTQTI